MSAAAATAAGPRPRARRSHDATAASTSRPGCPTRLLARADGTPIPETTSAGITTCLLFARLLISLIQACAPDPEAIWSWSRWRRRRQYQARLCRHRQRGCALTVKPADFRASGGKFTRPAAATTWPRIRGRYGTIDLTTGETALPSNTSSAAAGMPARRLRRPAARASTLRLPDVQAERRQLVQAPRPIQQKDAYILLTYWCMTG